MIHGHGEAKGEDGARETHLVRDGRRLVGGVSLRERAREKEGNGRTLRPFSSSWFSRRIFMHRRRFISELLMLHASLNRSPIF